MTLQLGALREALLDAGASEEKASKAAEELAAYERDMASIRSDLKLLKWMVGALYAPMVAIMIKLFVS